MRNCWLLCFALVSAPFPVRAEDVHAVFSTFLAGRQDPRNGDAVSVIPVYELIALDADKLGLPFMETSRLVFNSWGRLQLGQDKLADNSADLNLLYLEGQKGRMRFRVGRQHLILGVGRMDLIDGIDTRVDSPHGVYAEAFAGFVVHPELNIRTNSWEGGARLAWNPTVFNRIGEIGLSYVQRREDGEIFRHDLGADAYTVVGPTQWTAMAVMGAESQQLIEARLAGTYVKGEQWRLIVDAERVAPALLIPLNSIFSVFADAPHDAFGGEIIWSPNVYWSATATGAGLLLDQSYFGYRASFGAVTYRDSAHRSAIGAELRRFKETQNGYTRGRFYSFLQVLNPLRLTTDVYVMRFDESINAVKTSTIAQVSATYDISKSMRIAATFAGGVTPWAKFQTEAMLRFAYGYNVDFSQEVRP